MGFGFLGHAQYVKQFEGNGHTVGASRYFGIGYIAYRNDLLRKERIIFDIDDVGSDPPQIYATSLSPITNDGRETFLSSQVTQSGFQGSVQGATINTNINYFNYNNNYIGYNYNSNAVLSPATRKWKLVLSRPEFISGIAVNVINGSATSTSSNISNGNVEFDLRQFTNLKYLSLTTGLQTNRLGLKLREGVENVYIALAVTAVTGTLPSTVKTLQIGSSLTGITSLISGLTNCELLTFGHPAGGYSGLINVTNTLSGALNLSHMNKLKVLALQQNPSLTSVTLPTASTGWTWVHLFALNTSVASSLSSTALNSMLASPLLKVFFFVSNAYTWSKAISNSDISTDLAAYNVANNSITGNITITGSRPNLREFVTGTAARTGTQQNSHSTVNITGLTGARTIQMAGSNISNLELPANTVCTSLLLGDNNLSIATNTNLLSKVNAMTALQSLAFSTGSNAAAVIGLGQGSAAGLGSNPSFTGLTNLTTLGVNACKITGSLTLPTGNVLVTLQAAGNTGITSIVNHTKTSLAAVQLVNNTLLTGAWNMSTSTGWNNIYIENCGLSSVNLSGRTSSGAIVGLGITSCPNLTTVVFPANPNVSENYRDISIANNASLSSIPNFVKTVPILNTGFGVFTAQNCALNITFPFGTGTSTQCIWRTINISNNGMSNANVDATINNIYTNRTKWSVWNGSHPKSLNISGTNAAPSGTYQAPAGFVLGSNDGTPASAKEQLYVLVNNYSWSVTYT